ncbi:hypothetical protein N2152v2_009276 [Parachlorella kessleri]
MRANEGAGGRREEYFAVGYSTDSSPVTTKQVQSSDLYSRPYTAPAANDGELGSGIYRGRSLGYGPLVQPGSEAASPQPAARPGSGFLRGLKQSPAGCLTGIMGHRPGSGRPGSASSHGTGAPGSPAFEVRGASLLGGAESPRVPSPKANGTHLQQESHIPKPPAASAVPPGVYSIHARAGYAAMHRTSSGGSNATPTAAPGSASSSPRRQQQAQRPSTPSVEGGLAVQNRADAAPPSSPTGRAAGQGQQHQQAQQHQQQRPRTVAAGVASSATSSASSSAGSSVSGADSSTHYATYHMPVAMGQASSAASHVSSASAGMAAPVYHNVMHLNPLFGCGDSQAAVTPAAAAVAALHGSHGAAGGLAAAAGRGPHQQQHEAAHLSMVTVAGLTVATQPPASPRVGTGLASAAATPSAHLQAASNLTMLNDSRPISPGPFLSAIVSGPGCDSGSRPVSPHMVDQPPTPGSFAMGQEPQGSPFQSLARASSISQQHGWAAAGSVPSSPKAAGVATAAAAGGAGYRTPIYNRDGKFVGWKQNSNMLKPMATTGMSGMVSTLPSSIPSSPTKAQHSAFEQEAAAFAPEAEAHLHPVMQASSSANPKAVVDADFAQYVDEPFKGFPDAENQVQGYVLGPVLGKGGFCSVRKALHELTGRTVACKIIEKSRLKDPKDRDRVDRECRVMRNLSNHVAIIRMYEACETPDYVYIMMEHCTRGSLLEYVRDKKKLPEEEAVVTLQQLLLALQFCHRKDVVHRDIKLENILIDGEGNMKLIDFGLCGYYVAGKRLRCHCGSPSYAAPEIVARKDYLGPPVDVWSLGIVLFAMLAGYLPFHAKEKKQLSEKILSGVYKPASWMCPEAADLLSRMLTLDPDQRITLEGVWAHPWVARARRWEPPGVGSGRVYRSLTDPTSGSVVPDEAVMEQLASAGLDVVAVRRALRMREANSLTATYSLMQEAGLEQVKQAALRSPPPEKWGQGSPTSTDFQWDFSPASSRGETPRSSPNPRSPSRFQQQAGSAAVGSPAGLPGGEQRILPRDLPPSTAGSAGIAGAEQRMLPRDLPPQAGGTDRSSGTSSPKRAALAGPVGQAAVGAAGKVVTAGAHAQQDGFFIKAVRGRDDFSGGSPVHMAAPGSPVVLGAPSPPQGLGLFGDVAAADKAAMMSFR